MHGFLFFHAAECLSRTAHVCGYRAASFADQKEKNDLDASERLENGKLASQCMSANVILMSNIRRRESRYYPRYAKRSEY